MTKGNVVNFLEGTVAGVALAVGASMFLSSKKGKELKKDIADVAADFYKSIAPRVKKIEKMGEKEYKLFMKNAAQQYINTKKISADIGQQLMEDAEQSWKHFAGHFGK